MHLPEGTLLQNGKYKIVRFIASGGFGCTYEGIQTMMGARVAIKEFFVNDFCNREEDNTVNVGTKSKVQDFQKLKKSFIKEAVVLFHMQNPHIVRVIDVFEENGTAYYVMDYIDGTSLAEIVSQKGKLHEDEALGYIFQVGDALKYVHSQNRLHLDIKPGNVMVDKNGKATLIDFGASKYYNVETGEQTSALTGVLTKPFASIEQIKGSFKNFNPAADIYALGATLYKLLTGKTPVDALERLTGGEALQPLPDNISPSTRNAVEAAMQIHNADRPQTIQEFERILMEKVDGNKNEGKASNISAPNQKVEKEANSYANNTYNKASQTSQTSQTVLDENTILTDTPNHKQNVNPQNNIQGNNAYQPSQSTIDERTIITDSPKSKDNKPPKYYSPGFPSPNQEPVPSGKITNTPQKQEYDPTPKTPNNYPSYPNTQQKTDKGENKSKTSILKRLLKIFLWVVGSLLALLVILFIIIRLFGGIRIGSFYLTDNLSYNEISNHVPVSENYIEENMINGHAYIDLGLPSGVKWATCNVGANSPEESGNYYAWGHTMAISPNEYGKVKYETTNRDRDWLISNGYIDDNYNLTLSHDAANYEWGSTWRMPTKKDIDELIAYVTYENTTLNGVEGLLLTSKTNGKKMFLPYAGGISSTSSLSGVGNSGRSWSSTLKEEKIECVYDLFFYPSTLFCGSGYYDDGCETIRAVSE